MTDDLLVLEPEIVARLTAVLGNDVRVLTASDISALSEASQPSPAVHVLYGNFRVADDQRIRWRMEQTWLVVAAVRNVGTLATGQDARRKAGQLAARAINALAGHKLPSAIKPMTLAPNPPSARYAAGMQYIPVAFLGEILFQQKEPTP